MSRKPHKIEKMLIIRLSSIGDIVLVFWIIDIIFKKNKKISVDILADKKLKQVFYPLKYDNLRILDYDKQQGIAESLRWRKRIRQEGYDWVMDLQNNLRSAIMTFLLPSVVRRMPKKRLQRWLFVHWRRGKFGSQHVLEKYSAALPDAWRPDNLMGSRPRKMDLEKISVITARQNSNGPVIIFPGAKHATKMWPAEYYRALIRQLTEIGITHIIIAGDSSDARLVEKWDELQLPGVEMAAGKTDLLQTWQIIEGASLVVGNDSAPMHMAAWLQIPCVSIWGSTTYHFGFYPLNPRGMVVENPDISCRPCSHLGFDSCPRTHFDCMKSIRVEQVLDACRQLLRKS